MDSFQKPERSDIRKPPVLIKLPPVFKPDVCFKPSTTFSLQTK